MEWVGLVALVLVLCYGIPAHSKMRRLEGAVKRLERHVKGESDMSKLIQELSNRVCAITSDELIQLAGKTELQCLVLDSDDEWVKIQFVDKKSCSHTKLIRIENIETIELLDAPAAQ